MEAGKLTTKETKNKGRVHQHYDPTSDLHPSVLLFRDSNLRSAPEARQGIGLARWWGFRRILRIVL